MRIRVGVNISKPLCRGRKIRHGDGEIGWVRFKYECLPNLCYWCGRLTHSDKECDAWVRSKGSLIENDRQYGSWLHAPTFNMRKCTTIRVGGAEDEENGGDVSGGESQGGVAKEVRMETNTDRSGRKGSNPDHGTETREEEGEDRAVTPTEPPHEVTDYMIVGKAEISESIARSKPDFQEVLNRIDAEISKFDSTVMGSNPIGPEMALVQYEGQSTGNTVANMGFNSELVMIEAIQGNPPDNIYKTRSWKRLVQDRTPIET